MYMQVKKILADFNLAVVKIDSQATKFNSCIYNIMVLGFHAAC